MAEVALSSRAVWIVLLIVLSVGHSSADDVNDLWLLISSYEDIGITVQDLAFFLVSHGYDATPERSYVTVRLPSGKSVYLTPNGGAPRLADLWMEPPKSTGIMQVIPIAEIQKDRSYNMTSNQEFIKSVSRLTMFPVTPLGMCYDGSQKLANLYTEFGYKIRYMYDPSGFENQGHLWIIVEDPDNGDRWLAVDSYYGVVTESSYYKAPYSFPDIKYLDSLNPKWRYA